VGTSPSSELCGEGPCNAPGRAVGAASRGDSLLGRLSDARTLRAAHHERPAHRVSCADPLPAGSLGGESRKQLQTPPRSVQVFHLRDERLDQEARTLNELAELFAQQAAWAESFTRLRPALEQFAQATVDVPREFLSRSPSDLLSEASSLRQVLTDAERELEPLRARVASLAGDAEDSTDSFESTIAAAQLRLDQWQSELDEVSTRVPAELVYLVQQVGGIGEAARIASGPSELLPELQERRIVYVRRSRRLTKCEIRAKASSMR
jgi:DNA repair exonuclease SbcCD ATPase subunit